MCGIVSIFDTKASREISKLKLERMMFAIRQRGPDNRDVFIDKGIGMGHHRLEIIDPNGGKQPMISHCGYFTIIFNGMIYNYRALKEILKKGGYIFHTQSDTEVLLAAYQCWGQDMCKHLDGFYSFIIYDRKKDILFGARDPLGKKPLFYHKDADGFFYCASSMQAILNICDIKPALSIHSVDDFLTMGFIAAPKTMYQNIFSLMPGRHFIFKKSYDRPKISSYEKPEYDPPKDISYQDAIDISREMLQHSVEKRLIADRPVAVLLSGGVDSAAITSLAQQATRSNVTTITARFKQKTFDEGDRSKLLAQHLGTQHHEYYIDIPDRDMIYDIADVAGEPFADASLIPTYLICKQAAQYAPVLLSGDGGDEFFFGYNRYQSFLLQEKIKRYIPEKMRYYMTSLLGRYYPQNQYVPKYLRFGSSFEAFSYNRSAGYLRNFSITREVIRDKIYSTHLKDSLGAYNVNSFLDNLFSHTKESHPLKQAQDIDSKLWLAGRMLVKADRASMGAGTEMRAPFLDYRLTEFLKSLPIEFFTKKNKNKKLLKDVIAPFVPNGYLNHPKKGFTFPLSHMLKTKWHDALKEVVYSPTLYDTGFFKQKEIEKIYHQHVNNYYDHSRLLWALIQYHAFL